MRRSFVAKVRALTGVFIFLSFSVVPAYSVDLKANFRLLGEVQGFGLGGYGDMNIHFGVNGNINQVGRLEKASSVAPLVGFGVLAPLVLQNNVVDVEFSVPFSLEVDQPGSIYIGFGDNGMGGFEGGSLQYIFDFSDNIIWSNSTLDRTCDQGLTLKSVTLADGSPLEAEGFIFDFVYANTVLVAGASAFDDVGAMPTTNTATPPARAQVFLSGGMATAKLKGAADGFCGTTQSLVDLDVNPEPNPFVFDMAFAAVMGSNNVKLTRTHPPVNTPPVVDAGENLNISSQYLCGSFIRGTATDADNDPLQYRWLDGQNEISTWAPIAPGTQPYLDLCGVTLSVGQHTLTLQVSDGRTNIADEMLLIIANTPPHAAPTGTGTYQIGKLIVLGGQISDFDNDTLTYTWAEGTKQYCSNSTLLPPGIPPGTPITLPDCVLPALELGHHVITLTVSDGINTPISADTGIDIVDTMVPTLAPVANKTILWPPNHKMVDIAINTHATDNGGVPLLGAAITSNEPVDGLGDGDTAPDWTDPVIDQTTGLITFQLRAERSGRATGRQYTITVTATDASGNRSTTPVVIIVPHDMRKN